MVYGTIVEKGEPYYTDLLKLFAAMDQAQLQYNWLVTACECNVENPVEADCRRQGYCWISGDDLTELVRRQEIQWIWAVLSGFAKDIPLCRVLAHPRPEADEYTGFWQNPISIQHPLAEVEIVPWDSSLTLFFSRERALTDQVRTAYPQCQDLTAYNAE